MYLEPDPSISGGTGPYPLVVVVVVLFFLLLPFLFALLVFLSFVVLQLHTCVLDRRPQQHTALSTRDTCSALRSALR